MSSPSTGPINKNNIHGNLVGYPLFLVNEQLMNNSSPRDFTSIAPIFRQPTPPIPQTPPFPHPLRPLEYWQTFAKLKRNSYIEMISLKAGISKNDDRVSSIDDRRTSIDDAHYWRCEAGFWLSKSQHEENKRREISIANYWKWEAEFWRSTLPEGCDASRDEIDNPEYWMRENMHYNELLERVFSDTGHNDPVPAAPPSTTLQVNQVTKPPLRRSARLMNLQRKSAAKGSTHQSVLLNPANVQRTKKRKKTKSAHRRAPT
ncbi:hypothetical protein ACJ72_03300 [Emergomyces africanus]|uniref:Uncharacterized protein n=1 Tax=Emergomyces africanus TaxID=1955775 RepID=A0A1B7NZZ2_9EURO|nr:hypothetical protein ACJ72_03300 [Emergomyces africanus]